MDKHFVKDVLQIDKSTVWLLVVFSIFISICSLVVPITVQAIVNTIAFSTIKRQFGLLAILVILVLGFAGILRGLQLLIVEYKEQELFSRVALSLTDRLSRLKYSLLEEKRNIQLVNLFLEVIPVQKCLMVIMIYLVEMVIQALTGFILLALYHPFFLALDIFLVILLSLSLYIPFKKAMNYAYDESDSKHCLLEWLEEYLTCPTLFKFSNNSNYLLKKIDNSLVNHLVAKQKMIKSILKHFFGLYSTFIIANAGLLLIGGRLVFAGELSLGQLVSAEIVLNLLLSSFIKLSYSLGSLYELIPSCKKVSKIFTRDYELSSDLLEEKEIATVNQKLTSAPQISFLHVSFTDERNYQVFSQLSFVAKAGEMTAFYSKERNAKHGIVNLISGLSNIQEGKILIDDWLYTEHRALVLREHMMLVREIEIFQGSIFENLTLGKDDIEVEHLYALFDKFEISKVINNLPEQVNSQLVACQKAIPNLDLYKLMIIRAILVSPKIILIDSVFDLFPIATCQKIKENISQMENAPTIILTTARKDVANLFTNKVAL